LSLLDPAQFQACFLNWIREIARLKLGEVIAIDGKSLNGSIDTWSGKTASQMISAWAVSAGLVIGQKHVPAGTNEIGVVPELLQVLMLKGCIVTVDAANCQTKNAKLIIERGGDYVMALKENQGTLYARWNWRSRTKPRRTFARCGTARWRRTMTGMAASRRGATR
jgi:predicted transposase YbfD/YdcC